MPKGPDGQKRPADAIGLAVTVAKIATGEIAESTSSATDNPAAELGRRGGKARAVALTPEQRAEIAKSAAAKRWNK